jgi:hypothetical protein
LSILASQASSSAIFRRRDSWLGMD